MAVLNVPETAWSYPDEIAKRAQALVDQYAKAQEKLFSEIEVRNSFFDLSEIFRCASEIARQKAEGSNWYFTQGNLMEDLDGAIKAFIKKT